MSEYFIGVDPGASGAIVIIGDNHIDPEWIKNDATESDLWLWLEDQAGRGRVKAVIERVHSMPGQGVASSFNFGRSYGFLRGLLVASRIPFDEVTPVKWQNAMKCRSKGDKNVTKARAQQLFPGAKVTHTNADAMLLAAYCEQNWGK